MHVLKGWWIWAIAALFYHYEFIQRVLPAVMISELMETAGSAVSLGAISAYYYYAYAMLQIPAGICMDRFSIRKTLSLAALVCVLGSFAFALAPNLLVAKWARFAIGAGSAFAFVGTLKLANSWIDRERFPLVVGLTNMWGVMGAMIGGAPIAYAIETHGSSTVLLMLSCIGLLIAFLLWVGIVDPITQSSSRSEKWYCLKCVLTCPRTWLGAIYGALIVAPISALPELWSVPFFMEVHHIDKPFAALANSYIFTGIAIGGPLIGWIAGKLSSLRPLFIVGSMLTTLALLLVLRTTPVSFYTLCAICLGYGIVSSHMLQCFTYVVKLHPPSRRGFAVGLTNTIVMLGGAVFQPLVGWFLDNHSTTIAGVRHFTVQDFQSAFTVLPFMLAIAFCLSFFFKGVKADDQYL